MKSHQYTGPGQVLAQFFLVDSKLTVACQSHHNGLFFVLALGKNTCAWRTDTVSYSCKGDSFPFDEEAGVVPYQQPL